MHTNQILREMRLHLNALALAVGSFHTPVGDFAAHSLRLARSHYGEVLGRVSHAMSPYAVDEAQRGAGGMRELAPEVDVADEPFPVTGDPLQDLDAMRRELEQLLLRHHALVERLADGDANDEVHRGLGWALLRLTEAKFSLGYELSRVCSDF